MLPWSTWVYMGGFWLGHLAMIRENDLLLRKIEKWEFFTSEQVRGFCVQNPLQGLVTASSLDCHCYKSGSPPVWNIEWENRTNTNAKREQPLGTGFDSHTKAVCRRDHFWLHRSSMAWYTPDGEKPCCTYKSASWRKLGSIAEDRKEYVLIRWARLFKPLSLSR